MKYTYYPGCSAHGTGREYDESMREVFRRLGIELEDVPDWNCCGASSAHMTDRQLALALPTRNLALAEKMGRDVVVSCPACFNRLRAAAHHLDRGEKIEGAPEFRGQVQIVDLVDALTNKETLAKIKELKRKDLTNAVFACYYGCLSQRPPEVTGAKEVENPLGMERVLAALGAKFVDWPYKTNCCGASLSASRGDIVASLSTEILNMARRAGADAVCVACPLCFMNLDRTTRDLAAEKDRQPMPVFYLTELMLLAFDPASVGQYLRRHLADAGEYLANRGLL